MTTKRALRKLCVKSPDGVIEHLSAEQFSQRFGVVYAPNQVIQAVDADAAYDEGEPPKGEFHEWQRPAVQRFFGEHMSDRPQRAVDQALKMWLYGDDIRNGFTADLCLAYINPQIDYGVLANQNLVPGDLVGEYTGVVRKRVDEDKDNIYLFTYAWQTVVDARDTGNYTRWINHSKKNANCMPVYMIIDGYWHILLIASKSIARGQQVLFNYGDGYWAKRATPVEIEQ